MKKKNKWYALLAGFLIMVSVGFYGLQLLIFHNERDTFFYLFQDFAFLPISVLIVTLIVDKLLKKRERISLHNKLNMVIGTFFSEMGHELLKMMIEFDRDSEQLKKVFLLADANNEWSSGFVNHVKWEIRNHPFTLELNREDVGKLRSFLVEKRPVLMRMLENPNLLEHDRVTELLWSISHLTEELVLRKNLPALHGADAEHIKNDMKRAFVHLLMEWTSYMKHLKWDYPYIFSLALRNNPFDKNPKIEIE